MIEQNTYILLVDDDPDDRYIIHSSFKQIHWHSKVKLVASAEEAMRYLESIPDTFYPALIVLDYNMPKTNGAEALTWLKRGDDFKNIPIVVYSSNMSSLLACKLSLMGAHCCFQKPRDVIGGIELAKTLKMIAEKPALSV